MANKYWNLGNSSGTKGGNLNVMIADMTSKADEMLDNLIEQKDYQDRTGNLVSSYAYAIFYKGEIVATKRSRNVATSSNKGKNASSEIDKVIKNKLATADKDRLVLVVFAAMFYGGILESGIRTKRKYMVIKDIIRDDVYSLTRKYKGNLEEYG